MILRIILLIAATLSTRAFSATYYVATTGSDSNSGASGSPFLTISKALRSVAPGDTVSIGAGSFAGAATTVVGQYSLPITIAGAGKGTTKLTSTLTIVGDWYIVTDLTMEVAQVTIQGNDVTLRRVEAWGESRCVQCVGCDRTTIDDCEFHHDNSRYGMLEASGANGLVTNTLFHHSNGNDAMRLNGCRNWTFRGNTFWHIDSPGVLSNTSISSNSIGTGAKVFTVSLSKAYVTNDRLRFTSGSNYIEGRISGISGTDLTISVTNTSGSGTYSSWTVATNDPGNHADSVQAFGRDNTGTVLFNSYGHLFERNLWKDCDGQIGNVSNDENPDVRDWVFRNNVFWNSRLQLNIYAQGFKFYNNTVYNTSGTAGFSGKTDTVPGPTGYTAGNGTPISVYNNIFCRVGNIESAGPYSGAGAFADYNLITDYSDDSAKTGYHEVNGINGGYTPSQIFVDPNNGDFHLVTGSPAIRTGTNPTALGVLDDFDGVTRTQSDIGAFQEAGATPPSTPNAPSGLAASTASSSAILLTWTDNSSEETGFEIERSADGSTGWTSVATLDPNTASFSDSGLSAATTYYYHVRATGSGGNSAFSSTASATTATPSTVNAPSNPRRRGVRGIF